MKRFTFSSLFLIFPFLLLLVACGNDPSSSTDLPAVIDNTDPGIAKLTDALRADPDNADLYAQRASMQYDKQNYDAAIADMVYALQLDSTNIGYHYNLADVYLDYYRSRLALRTLQRAAALDPDNVETQLRLAETQLILKQYDGALEALNEVTRVDPRNPDAYLLLSQTFLETGDTTRAINSAEVATEIDPDMTDAYITLGQLLFAKGLAKAEQYFDAAVAIDPQDVYALHAKADYLRDTDRLPEAIATYRAASLADRQYVAGYFNAGLLYLEQDSIRKGLAEFDLVIKNDPIHIRAYAYRGYARERLGDAAGACKDYDTALRFSPDYEFALDGYARMACK